MLLRFLMERNYKIYWHVAPLFNPKNYGGKLENMFPNITCINNLCIPTEFNIKVNGLSDVSDLSYHPRAIRR